MLWGKNISSYDISTRTVLLLSRCHPEVIWWDAALRMMVRKIFSPFWKSSFAQPVHHPFTVSVSI